MKRLLLLGMSALFLIVVATPGAAAGKGTVPAGSHAYGGSLLKWGERWTAWGFGSSTNPFLNDICGEKVGGMFFLNAAFDPGTTDVSCQLPPGTPLLASPGGITCWADPGQTDEEVLACPSDNFYLFTDPNASLDGRALEVGDPVRSGIFTIPLQEGNFIETIVPDVPYGNEVRAAFETWLLRITPLPPGRHTVVLSDRVDGDLFEIVFHITVGKGGHPH